MELRRFKAVKNHPGIFAGTRPGQGRPDRWVVSYRVRGLGQRTKTFYSLSDARQFRGELQTKEKQELRRMERGKVVGLGETTRPARRLQPLVLRDAVGEVRDGTEAAPVARRLRVG